MKYIPKQSDFDLLYQTGIKLHFKAEVLNLNGTVIDVLNGVIDGGSISIDSTSDVRRTTSITVIPTDEQSISIAEDSLFWLNKDIHIYIGLENIRTGIITWYSQGYYVFTSAASSYDYVTNQLTLSCGDWCVKIDGTKNGVIGQLQTIIPAYSIEASKIWVVECEAYTGGTTWGEAWTWAKGFYNPSWCEFTEAHQNSLRDLYYDYIYNYSEDTVEEKLEPIKAIYTEENSKGFINSCEARFDGATYVTVMKHNILRDALISTLTQVSGIDKDKVMIDDIGEYKGQPEYNDDYVAYRKENPLWNSVPYDLEFQCGDTKLAIATTIRDLYPNWEFFFDINNIAVCQMIPSCESDPIMISNDILQDFLIAEDVSIDMTEVKNVCEVWGQVFDTDFYTETVSYADSCYALTVDAYESYCHGDVVSFLCPATSTGNVTLNINNLGVITLYDENTEEPYAEQLDADTCYTIKIKRTYVDKKYVSKAYMQGTYQVHGMSILSNGKCTEEYVLPSGNTTIKYSKEYFQELYNCKNVNIQIVPDSPYAVEKLGELLFVGTGNDFENITSDTLCLARCDYELYVHSRLTDSITISTVIMPFLDVNIKVAYQRSDSDHINQYIIKNISHEFTDGTSTISMMRFYDLYEDS